MNLSDLVRYAIATVIGIGLFSIGASGILMSNGIIGEYTESVQGEVTQSELKIGDFNMDRGAETDVKDYQLNVEYTYKVKGNTYTNDRIKGPWLLSSVQDSNATYKLYDDEKPANKDLKKYSEGTKLTVHYNAENPKKSFIEKRSLIPALFLMLMGLAFSLPLILGVVNLISSIGDA